MATSEEIKEIRNLIWQYKDTADKSQKQALLTILKHEVNLLKKEV